MGTHTCNWDSAYPQLSCVSPSAQICPCTKSWTHLLGWKLQSDPSYFSASSPVSTCTSPAKLNFSPFRTCMSFYSCSFCITCACSQEDPSITSPPGNHLPTSQEPAPSPLLCLAGVRGACWPSYSRSLGQCSHIPVSPGSRGRNAWVLMWKGWRRTSLNFSTTDLEGWVGICQVTRKWEHVREERGRVS